MSAASRAALTFALAAAASALLAGPALARNAYVTNETSDSVSVIDTQANATVGSPIAVGDGPVSMAITPDGARGYVANRNSDSVSVIDTTTNTGVVPVAVGDVPRSVAITPDGARAYVANAASDSVSVIDTQANATVGSPIAVGDAPFAIAITPDGARAYVANAASGNVSVIDTATNTIVSSPIVVGSAPRSVTITPDGTRAYVANAFSGSVSAIDTQANTTVGSPIAVGTTPQSVAITPDGARAYVANSNSHNVSVIDTATNTTVGSPIAVGNGPAGIAITPDGTRAYVANAASGTVSVIDTATNTTVSSPITVGNVPGSVAITPNQGPRGAFSATRRATRAAAGQPTAFDGHGSNDSDGTVARYDWEFGDGTALADGGPTPTHIYSSPGTYTATLTVTDNEGCSAQQVFTGRTAYCNGSGAARAQMTIDAQPPNLVLSGKRKQRLAKAVTLKARSDEVADATVTGKLIVKVSGKRPRSATKAERFELKRQTKTLVAATPQTFRLKLSRKALRAAQATLADDGRVKARLTIEAADQAGNHATGKRAVKLTAPRKRG